MLLVNVTVSASKETEKISTTGIASKIMRIVTD